MNRGDKEYNRKVEAEQRINDFPFETKLLALVCCTIGALIGFVILLFLMALITI